ncbi:MAG: tetratricopeptide repeat protein [Myxococcota bacterium]
MMMRSSGSVPAAVGRGLWRSWFGGVVAVMGLVACGGSPPPPPETALVADPPSGDAAGTPGEGLADLDRGIAYVEKEAWEDAKEHLERAVAARPEDGDARYYLAVAHLNLGDAVAAEAGFKAAIERDTGLYLARAQLGGLYAGSDPPRAREAIEVLEPALAAIPDGPDEKSLRADVAQVLGFAHRVEKNYAASQQHYEASLRAEDNPQVRFAMADMLLEAGRKDEARAALERYVATVQDDPKILVAVARMLARAGGAEPCVTALDRALTLAPKVKTLFIDRGRCHLQAGDAKAAREDFNRALKLDDRFQDAYFFLGLSWLESNNRPRAVEAFQQVVRLDKTSKVGQAAQKRLDGLAGRP